MLFFISFCCCIFICRCSSFCCCSSITFSFRRHSSPFRGLSPAFYTHFILSAQPIAEWFATLPFSTIPLIFLLRVLRVWVGIFYPQAFFTSRSFSVILTCVYQGFPESRQFFLLRIILIRSFEDHTDPRNTNPAHLSVWSTVIHNLHLTNNSVLNSTIY